MENKKVLFFIMFAGMLNGFMKVKVLKIHGILVEYAA